MNHHSLTPQRSRAEASGREVSTFKVTKKLTPGSPGAQKLQDLYGNALVCVRHRITADGRNRCTTVELLVEQTPMRRRASPVVGAQLAFAGKDLQALLAQSVRLGIRLPACGRCHSSQPRCSA